MAKNKQEELLFREMEQFMANDKTTAQLDKRISQLKERKSDEEKKAQQKVRSARTHRLCTIGADIEKIFGYPLEVSSGEYKEFLDAVKMYVDISVEKPFYFSFDEK